MSQFNLSNMYKIEIYSERLKGAKVFGHSIDIHNMAGMSLTIYPTDNTKDFIVALLDNSDMFRLNEPTSGEGGYVDSVGREWECQTLVYVNKDNES